MGILRKHKKDRVACSYNDQSYNYKINVHKYYCENIRNCIGNCITFSTQNVNPIEKPKVKNPNAIEVSNFIALVVEHLSN